MKVKLTNTELELRLIRLQPLLPHRDKVGYIAARNTRIIKDALTEFLAFKSELIQKYGEVDKDEHGNELDTVSIKPTSPNFQKFSEEFNKIKDIEQEVDLMTIPYEEIIGILNGEEILSLEWMFTE